MPTYPAPCPGFPGKAPWPRVIILVIILTFVVAMTGLGYAPGAAVGIAVAAITVGIPATADSLPDAQA